MRNQFSFGIHQVKILGNAFTIKRAVDILMMEDHREISNNVFKVQTFDPIIDQLPSGATWIEVRLQEDLAVWCVLKTPNRQIAWANACFQMRQYRKAAQYSDWEHGAGAWWLGSNPTKSHMNLGRLCSHSVPQFSALSYENFNRTYFLVLWYKASISVQLLNV